MVSIAQAFVSMGQGYLDQDKAISMAKAEAAEKVRAEKAATHKELIKDAFNLFTPEFMPTINKLAPQWRTKTAIMENPWGFMNAVTTAYEPPKDPVENPFKAYLTKIIGDKKNLPQLNKIKEKLTKKLNLKATDWDKVLLDPKMSAMVISEWMGQKGDDEGGTLSDKEAIKQAIGYFDPTASVETKTVASMMQELEYEEGGEGAFFTRQNIDKDADMSRAFLSKAVDLAHSLAEADKETKNDTEGKKATPFIIGEVELPYNRDGNLKALSENEANISEFLMNNSTFISNIIKHGTDQEKNQLNALLNSHLEDFVDINTKQLMDLSKNDPGRIVDKYSVTQSKVFKELPKSLQTIALKIAHEKEKLDFMNIEVGAGSNEDNMEDGQSVTGQSLFKTNITKEQKRNNEELSLILGFDNVNHMYEKQPNLLLIDQKMMDAVYNIVSHPDFNTVTGDDSTTSLLQTNFDDWSAEARGKFINMLQETKYPASDIITMLAIMKNEGPESYLGDPMLYFTPTVSVKKLETALKEQRDSLLPQKMQDKAFLDLQAANKLVGLFDTYDEVIIRTGVGIGAGAYEFYNNMIGSDLSLYKRIFNKGASEASGKNFVDSVIISSLKEDGGGRYTEEVVGKDSDGKDIIVKTYVDEEVLQSMQAKIADAYENAPEGSDSFEYGRKRTLELYIAYTMARLFDDNGRISNQDLDIQLVTFRGRWDANTDTIRGAISEARKLVVEQSAINRNILGINPDFKIKIRQGDKNVTYTSSMPIARVGAVADYVKLVGFSGQGNTKNTEFTQHNNFNVANNLSSGSGFITEKVEGATYDGKDVFRVVKVHNKKDVFNNIGLYVYEANPADSGKASNYVKIPWAKNSLIAMGDDKKLKKKSTGSLTFISKSKKPFEWSTDGWVYSDNNTIVDPKDLPDSFN